MKPIVAIVGRPNVGKSTLFNRLTRSKMAIVEDYPGVTRDRLYQDAEWNNRKFTLIDTGGIEVKSDDTILAQVRTQAQVAMEEADVIIFMCDIKAGVTNGDCFDTAVVFNYAISLFVSYDSLYFVRTDFTSGEGYFKFTFA